MTETLQDHDITISIGGRPLCNLRFADDIDLMGGSMRELQDLTDKLTNRANAYGMEVSTEKSNIMISSANNANTKLIMDGEPLEEVSQLKYWPDLRELSKAKTSASTLNTSSTNHLCSPSSSMAAKHGL